MDIWNERYGICRDYGQVLKTKRSCISQKVAHLKCIKQKVETGNHLKNGVKLQNQMSREKGKIMKMKFVNWIKEGIVHPRVAVYLKIIAVLMLLSALSHLGSIMGIIGETWMAKPWLFRVADLLLLPTCLVLAWGLWRTMFWAVVTWLATVVLFQAIPFLFFGEFFASNPSEQTMHYGQVGFHAVMLGILLLLLPRKQKS